MNILFAIPIDYVHKYASNNTTSDEIINFVEDMIADWENENIDLYEVYAEKEKESMSEE